MLNFYRNIKAKYQIVSAQEHHLEASAELWRDGEKTYLNFEGDEFDVSSTVAFKTLDIPEDGVLDVEMNITYRVSGGYRPATYYEPAEYPEIEDVEIEVNKILVKDAADKLYTRVIDYIESQL